nr:MAG TPA: hypothetical protein [Caudoviricetes sp.]
MLKSVHLLNLLYCKANGERLQMNTAYLVSSSSSLG